MGLRGVVLGAPDSGKTTLVESLWKTCGCGTGITRSAGDGELEISLATGSGSVTLRDAMAYHRDVFVVGAWRHAVSADLALVVVRPGQSLPEMQLCLADRAQIPSLVVAVSHMDSAGFGREKFEEAVSAFRSLLSAEGRTLWSDFRALTFVPVSAKTADGLLLPSQEKMPWYSGPSLLQALEAARHRCPDEGPLRLFVESVEDDLCRGTVLRGTLRTGQSVVFCPMGVVVPVLRIVVNDEVVNTATATDKVVFFVGTEVCMSLKGKHSVRNLMCGDPFDEPPVPAVEFIAVLTFMRDRNLYSEAICSCQRQRTLCTIEEVIWSRRDAHAKAHPEMICAGELALVRIVPSNPLFVEDAASCRAVNAIVLEDTRLGVAFGVVVAAVHKS